MHVDLTISCPSHAHNVPKRLAAVFGPNDAAAVRSSVALRPELRSLIAYSTVNISFGMYCSVITDRQLQVLIEPRGTNVRRTCQLVWHNLQRALGGRKVELVSVVVVDSVSAEELLHGGVGFGAQLGRSAIYHPIVVGVATAIIVLAIVLVLRQYGQNPPMTAYLSVVPGLVSALWFVGVAVRDWAKRTIQWT